MTAGIELFAGSGPMGLGLERQGIHATGIEWDANAVATRRAAGMPTIHADVTKHGPADFPGARVIAGGPPCQTFTMAGNGSGRAEIARVVDAVKLMGAGDAVDLATFADPRTALVLEPLRWILTAALTGSPYEAVILEQVPAVLPIWEAYAAILEDAGYKVATGTLRTEEHGLPQTRKRAVLVARLGVPVALPAPTHRTYRKGVPRHEGDRALKPWVSMGDVLDRPQPFTVISNYGTGGDPKNRGRRSSSEPAFTVTGKISRFRLVDTDGNELPRFTHAEAGQLQGLPADWPWSGNDISQQIGNACPAPLAAALAGAVTGDGI